MAGGRAAGPVVVRGSLSVRCSPRYGNQFDGHRLVRPVPRKLSGHFPCGGLLVLMNEFIVSFFSLGGMSL
jgi:hypothetical protein